MKPSKAFQNFLKSFRDSTALNVKNIKDRT